MSAPMLALCSRVDSMPEPVAGSEQVPCFQCGALLWLSPSSKRMGVTHASCDVCLPLGVRLELRPETFAEVVRVLEGRS